MEKAMCVATVASMTLAVKGRDALTARGIQAAVVGVDPSLTKRGCAYGIRFPCARRGAAERILRQRGIAWGTILGGEGESGT